nr:hypothetical protein [uncultured Allomuricauda sp.]
MKKVLLALFAATLFIACTDDTKQEVNETAKDFKEISIDPQATGKGDDGSPGDRNGDGNS